MGDYVTITAQQSAERLLSIRCAFILFAIIAICFTVWCINTNRKAAECTTAKYNAMKQRAMDRNKLERQNWIDANCDLMGQVELLKSENEKLRKENDRMRNIMAQVKVADLK